jgi:hypothetical protein
MSFLPLPSFLLLFRFVFPSIFHPIFLVSYFQFPSLHILISYHSPVLWSALTYIVLFCKHNWSVLTKNNLENSVKQNKENCTLTH